MVISSDPLLKMLNETQKTIVTIGLAVTIIRNRCARNSCEETSVERGSISNNKHSSSTRSYEDEINEISRCLLETGVQHQFPRALEIQLDFTLFNVDEGMPYSSSTSAALDIGINTLFDGENFDQIGNFSEHLSKRLLQRSVGRSDVMYERGLFVTSMLCGISDSSSSVSSKINGHSDPPIYTRWILEALNLVIGRIGSVGLDIMQNPYEDQSAMHDYRIYERLIAMSAILKEGIMQQVEFEDICINRNHNNQYNSNDDNSSQQQYHQNERHHQEYSEERRRQECRLESDHYRNDKQVQKKPKTGDEKGISTNRNDKNISSNKSNIAGKNTDNIDDGSNRVCNEENSVINLNDLPAADWAMAMIARTYDKINELPEVKTAYQSIVESLEQDNMRKGQMR